MRAELQEQESSCLTFTSACAFLALTLGPVLALPSSSLLTAQEPRRASVPKTLAQAAFFATRCYRSPHSERPFAGLHH